jgi:soluble lytic murein transglycosylase-like protein
VAASSCAIAGEAAATESVSVDRIIRDTHAYVLQVPDADRYRLRPSADWVLRSPSQPAPVVAAAPKPAPSPALARKRFHAEIASAAHKAGVDPALVHAVIGVESAYRENAVSPKGAVGLMQVMPETGRRYGVENLTLPSQNIRAGTRYLSDLMRMFNGDLSLVLAAYNAGENAVIRYGGRVPPYPETRQYVPRVLSIYRALGGNAPAQGQ